MSRAPFIGSLLALAACLAWGLAFAAEPNAPDTGPKVITKVHVELVRLSLERYSQRATHIVVASVLRAKPVFPEAGIAYTDYTLLVHEQVKGSTAKEISCRVIGASSKDRITIAAQAPHLSRGDVVLLFLDQVPNGDAYGIIGLEQGTYRVTSSNDDSPDTVSGLHAQGEALPGFIARINALAAEKQDAAPLKGGK